MSDFEQQITEALEQHATKCDGLWYFGAQFKYGYPEATARMVVEACLLLGTRITDTISTEAYLSLARRIVTLERAVTPDAIVDAIRRHERVNGPIGELRP